MIRILQSLNLDPDTMCPDPDSVCPDPKIWSIEHFDARPLD
jgi:hypothetical protein